VLIGSKGERKARSWGNKGKKKKKERRGEKEKEGGPSWLGLKTGNKKKVWGRKQGEMRGRGSGFERAIDRNQGRRKNQEFIVQEKG